jgi:hypothetical protein
MVLQRLKRDRRKRDDAVLVAFAAPDDDLAAVWIEILDAELQAFVES